jgi:uncharacterized protein involved in tolerance to divalent cations
MCYRSVWRASRASGVLRRNAADRRNGHYAFMPTSSPNTLGNPSLDALAASFDWYRRHARYARGRYHGSEILLVVVAAAIPASAAYTSDQRVSATLGALVVVLTGVRSIYRWHEDWLRSSEACAQLETARQLYMQRASPYAGTDRDELLVRRVRDIEVAETTSWVDLRKSAATEASAGRG